MTFHTTIIKTIFLITEIVRRVMKSNMILCRKQYEINNRTGVKGQ